MGENHAPLVPFGFDITGYASPGCENLLVIRIHEQARVLAFMYNFHGNWSGLYRDVELTATGENFLEYLWFNPSVERGKLRIRTSIGGPSISGRKLKLDFRITSLCAESQSIEHQMEIGGVGPGVWNESELEISSPCLWSPESPNLYKVEALLKGGKETMDTATERFGFVKLSTRGKQILVNNEPYYMRQSCDHFSTPEMGCPDTDRQRWLKKLTMLRSYGYNGMRLPTFVYGPEFYDAADEAGILVQGDMGMLGGLGGSSVWHVYQWPQPMPDMYEAIKWQWDHIVMRDVNHPSANMYSMSNEFGWCADGTVLEIPYSRIAWRCYNETKEIKPSSLIIYTDGGYRKNMPQDYINDDASMDDKCDKPLINHEFRWWSSFPDVRIIRKYKNTAVKPTGQELALEAAAKYGITHVLPQAAENSQRLQFIEVKTKMESCRRDYPNLAGIEHTNAMDLTLSSQGIIDEFYEKKYASRNTWLHTNGDTVILAGLNFNDRVLTSGDGFKCSFYVSDYSHPHLKNPSINWKLKVGGKVINEGRVDYTHIPFKTTPAGSISINIKEIKTAVKAVLEAELVEGKRKFSNEWSLWLFPRDIRFSKKACLYGDIKYTWVHSWAKNFDLIDSMNNLVYSDKVRAIILEKLDDKSMAFVKSGGRIILAASEGLVRPMRNKSHQILGEQYFNTPPAHYPPHEDGHDGTIIKDHPVFGDFPHEGFADLQFYRMIFNTPAIDLDPLGLNTGDPAFRQMHSYSVCRPLAYLINASIGKGGLIICALNLDRSFAEARYLLSSICNHAVSDDFRPDVNITDEVFNRIRKGTDIL